MTSQHSTMDPNSMHITYLNPNTRQEIEEMMDGDAEMIIDLIDTLIDTTPELLTELEQGVQKSDPHGIREAAHSLKSSFAQLGAMKISDMCKEMEMKGKNSDLAGVPQLYQEIKQEYQIAEQALEAWKNSFNNA